MRHFAAILLAGAVLTTAAPSFAQSWPGISPQEAFPGQSNARQRSSGGASEAEFRMRMALMQRSMGFGGIFAPFIKSMTQPSSSDHRCGNYSDYGACQAAKAGQYWSADRLQRGESGGSEHDWYNH